MTNPHTPSPDYDDLVELRQDEASPLLRSVAVALGVVLGVVGAHRFYAGKQQTGFLQLLSLGGLGVWWLYDMILLLTGEFRDVHGRRISRWSRDEPVVSRRGDSRRVDELSHEMDTMRTELADLAERVDFAERLLAQHRERPRLPS